MTLEKQIITFMNHQPRHLRRFFHLAYTHVVRDNDTSQLPLYSLVRHADLVALVEQNRAFLACIDRNLTGGDRLHFHEDPDFNMLIGGECSCMSEQREFDASIDDLCDQLAELLRAILRA
ncbi:hypothetical protein DNN94_23075 [Escherichia coli]|uniref:hypothetical protein n=1 Tax=Escherichia coli TaxID=562 RepID=UPI001594A3B4|nr:hypothetical protein [Escherichia coli]NVG84703.1 hypothetical protein [Escherichia coli]